MASKRVSFQKLDLIIQGYCIIERTITLPVIKTHSVFTLVFTYLQFHYFFYIFGGILAPSEVNGKRYESQHCDTFAHMLYTPQTLYKICETVAQTESGN